MSQLELLPGKRGRRSKAKLAATPAPDLPVAHVVLASTALALDREFDYLVPAELSESAEPGCRVRVRLRGRLVDGFVVRRSAGSARAGELQPIVRVNGPPVLTKEVMGVVTETANYYAGSRGEVLRDAIPARVARMEQVGDAQPTGRPRVASEHAQPWPSHVFAELASGRRVRSAVVLPVTTDAATWLHQAVEACRGPVVILVPDSALLGPVAQRLQDAFGSAVAVVNSAHDDATRYAEHLRMCRERVEIVVGTRQAVFAPLTSPMIIIWDDDNDSYHSPRAPGWRARDVAILRAHLTDASFIIAGWTLSVASAELASTGWLSLETPTQRVRGAGPAVRTRTTERHSHGSTRARIPDYVHGSIRTALKAGGPVLVQVARAGYYPAMRCKSCERIAQCEFCSGSVARNEAGGLSCGICGEAVPDLCHHCGQRMLTPIRVGSSRTAVELAAAFPGATVVASDSKSGILRVLPSDVDIAVATVGAEPIARDGYLAAALLDGNALLARTDLRTESDVLRRWFAAAALVRPKAAGGVVIVTAEPSHRCVQSLLRYDSANWARRELSERRELGFPPTVRALAIDVDEPLVANLAARLERAPANWRQLGPVPGGSSRQRFVVLVPRQSGRELAAFARSLREGLQSSRSGGFRVRLDPDSLLGSGQR